MRPRKSCGERSDLCRMRPNRRPIEITGELDSPDLQCCRRTRDPSTSGSICRIARTGEGRSILNPPFSPTQSRRADPSSLAGNQDPELDQQTAIPADLMPFVQALVHLLLRLARDMSAIIFRIAQHGSLWRSAKLISVIRLFRARRPWAPTATGGGQPTLPRLACTCPARVRATCPQAAAERLPRSAFQKSIPQNAIKECFLSHRFSPPLSHAQEPDSPLPQFKHHACFRHASR